MSEFLATSSPGRISLALEVEFLGLRSEFSKHPSTDSFFQRNVGT